MPYEIPNDLIHQLQILLRTQSALGSYNPDDPSLPDLPTLEESIAEFDPSPDDGDVRCKHCRGKLLRGAESVICVYCGRGQTKEEAHPGSISFNRSVGFRWLIQSLGLDGAEIVAPTVDASETFKGQSVRNEEVSLSDFLGLELEWTGDSERLGVALEHKAEMPVKRLLDLAGVESSDLFSGNTSTIASLEQALPKESGKHIESAILHGQYNVTLSENQWSFPDVSVKPRVLEQANPFSGWEADFQSASSDTLSSDIKSSKPSGIHDVVSPIDSEFASAKDLTDGRSEDSLVSQASRSNWVANPQSRSISGETVAGKQEIDMEPEDSQTLSKSENISTPNDEWFENQQETSSSEVPNIGKISGENFYVAGNSLAVSIDTEKNHWDWGVHNTFIPENEKNPTDDGSSDAWDDFSGSWGASDNPALTSSVQVYGDVPFDACNDFTGSSATTTNQVPTESRPTIEGGVGNSVDAWDSLASLSTGHKNQHQKLLSENNQDNSFGPWINLSTTPAEPLCFQASVNNSSANGADIKGESIFDMWNDITGSSVEQGSQQESHTEVAGFGMGGAQNLADEWGNFMSINNINPINSAQIFKSVENDEHDPFNARNAFTSSNNLSSEKAAAKDIKVGTWDIISTTDYVQQTSGEQASESNITTGGDDLFDSWSDFRSSGNMVHDNLAGFTTAFDNSKVDKYVLSNSIFPQANIADSYQPDAILIHGDVMNDWSNFRNLAHVTDSDLPARGSVGSQSKLTGEGDVLSDWSALSTADASDKHLKTDGGAVSQGRSENLNQFDDAWADFTSSKIVQGDHDCDTSKVHNNAPAVNQHDPFESWSTLMSSSGQLGDWTRPSEEHPSKTSLVNSATSSLIMLNGMTPLEVSPPEAPNWFRVKNESADADGNAKEIVKNDDITVVSEAKSKDAELLISQMHDLSFMLEGHLLVPKQ